MAAAVLAEQGLAEVLLPGPDAENHPPAPNGRWGPPRGEPPTEEVPNCPRGKELMSPQSHADTGADGRTDSITGPVLPLRPGAEGRGPFAGSSPVSQPHPSLPGAPTGAPWGLFKSPTAGPGASAAFMLLREAPQAVRDVWNASFDSKRLRRRHFLLQVDLPVVCSWISMRLEAAPLPTDEGSLDAATFATATAVYGQLVPQLLWATAVVASGLTTLTLQGTTALWARLQLLALDATSSSAAAAAAVAGTSSVGGKSLKYNDHAAALYVTSRIFGRRKRRKPQQQQQRQQQDEGTVAAEAAAGLSGGSAEPELLLQQIPRLRGNASQASALLSSILSVAGREQEGSPSLNSWGAPSPFAALRQDLLQLGALRPPGGSRLLLGGGSAASSSTSSIAASVASDTASAAAAAAVPSNCSTNDMGAMGADRWALMPWQSAAAAAAATLQHGLSRRSSFSSVASDLLPPGQQPQGLLLQGPLALEVPVGAAVDPAVASPFRLQQQQQQQLLPSEPSSVESSATKRTAASAVGTPDGGWAPQALLQQDIDIGDWNLPEEEGMLQQGAADVAAAATAAAAGERQQLGIAAAEALRLAQSSSPRKRAHRKQLKLQLDEALCRSQLTPAAAAAAAPAAGAALRLLEAGTEDAEALRKSFRCYWGILKRQMDIRAFLEPQQLLQQRMPRKESSATGAAAAAAAHADAAPLAPLLAGGVSPLSLPSAAQAATAAVRSVCLGGAPVRVAPGEAQQHHAAAAVAAESAAPFIRTDAAAHSRGEGGFWCAAAAAGGAQSVAAEAAAVAAAAATRRRSSWLSRENLLKGFESPLPPAEGSDDAEEAERWGESHWEQGPEAYPDDHQQQQQRQQQQQQQQQQRPQQQPPPDGIREEFPQFTPDEPPGAFRGPRGVYKRKNGVTVTLWPSAASLFELVERHQAAPGSWVFDGPPPPGAPGSPGTPRAPGAPGAPSPVSLSELLSGHSKRTAARAFRDALALHAQGLFVLKQQMPEAPGVPGAPGAPDVQGSSEAPSYPALLILPEGATEDEEVLSGRVSKETAAAGAAGAGAAAEASGAADMDGESVTQQQTDKEVRRAAAAVAAAAEAAAAAAAERGEAFISDEQLENAVQFLVTGLLDRLQTQPRLHAHELIQWFVREALPSSALSGVAPSAAWEAKAVYAICTLIDEGVFLASTAAHDAAPVQLATAGWGHEGLGDRLKCPFWLNGVSDAD